MGPPTPTGRGRPDFRAAALALPGISRHRIRRSVTSRTRENPAFDDAAESSARGLDLRAAALREARVKRLAWVALAFTGMAACGVFWGFDALPFQDLPAHAGLIALRARIESSVWEQQYFVHAPHIGPYTLFRFLGAIFARVLGPVSAVRLLATLPLVTLPTALILARRRLHGEWSPTYGFLGIVLSFGFMTLLGFASYQLGLSVLVFTLPLWLGHAERPAGLRGEILLVGLCLLLFIAHGHAFLLFSLIVFVSVASMRASGLRPRFVALRPVLPALALAAGVAAWERVYLVPPGAVAADPHTTTVFQSAYDKFTLLITPTLMTRSGVDFLIGVVVWLWTLLNIARMVSLVGRGAGSFAERRLLGATAVLFAAFVVLPHNIRWFGFVDGRLVPLLLLLPALAARPNLLGSTAAAIERRVAPVLTIVMVGAALVASHRFQHEARGWREVLGQVPTEARLLNLPLDPNSDVFTAHPFVHYDKLVMAERPSVPSDVWFHQGSALYPTAKNPALHLPASYIESDLKRINWPAYELADWDYVLVRTRPEASLDGVPAAL